MAEVVVTKDNVTTAIYATSDAISHLYTFRSDLQIVKNRLRMSTDADKVVIPQSVLKELASELAEASASMLKTMELLHLEE